MKKIALVLALVIPTTALADMKYDLRPVRTIVTDETCGLSQSMMKDRHVLTIKDDGRVFVDGMEWQIQQEEPDLLVTFHKKPGQHTFLMMEAYVSTRGVSARYIIVGITAKRRPCFDLVYLDGNVR